MSRFININMNVRNTIMTYIVKWREYIFFSKCFSKEFDFSNGRLTPIEL